MAEVDPIDFDPTTEEGREEIDEEINRDIDVLLPRENETEETYNKRIYKKFKSAANYVISQIKTKNPGKVVPEYMELKNMDVENYEVDKEIKSKFPNADTSQFMSKIDDNGIVKVKSLRENARNWYPLYANGKLNPKIPKSVLNALEGGLVPRLDKAEEELTEKSQLLEEKEEEENNIMKGLESLGQKIAEVHRKAREYDSLQTEQQDREKEYMEQNRRLLDAHNREKADMQERLNSLSKEKRQLRQEINQLKTNVQNIRQELLVKEEQLRQNQQAIEDYEQQIERQREIINDINRTDEEREVAQQEINRLQERIDELNAEREQIETELGLTLREKIKRIFKKYGFTVVSVAIAVSTVIGVIISQLKNGLSSVAKGVGNGFKTLGKKLGQILPGMIGAIASFIFKTAGEVVSFVAEHAWLLIVAVVVFVVEKMKK